jgi:hypothetical protein
VFRNFPHFLLQENLFLEDYDLAEMVVWLGLENSEGAIDGLHIVQVRLEV